MEVCQFNVKKWRVGNPAWLRKPLASGANAIVNILKIDANLKDGRCVVAIYKSDDGCEHLITFTEDGFFKPSKEPSDLDLMMYEPKLSK